MRMFVVGHSCFVYVVLQVAWMHESLFPHLHNPNSAVVSTEISVANIKKIYIKQEVAESLRKYPVSRSESTAPKRVQRLLSSLYVPA